MNTMKTTLEERLKLAMKGPPKISGKQLAAATGARGASVSGWCTGKSKTMKASYLVAAAKLLGVRPEWLADGVGSMTDSQSLETRSIPAEPLEVQKQLDAKHSDMALVLADVFDALPVQTSIRARALGKAIEAISNIGLTDGQQSDSPARVDRATKPRA